MSFPRYPEYKDSGLGWLGAVPKHWQIKPLKFVASVQTGVAKGKDNAGKNTIEVSYLRVANVQDGYLALDDVSRIEIPEELLGRYSLQAGDVLMNEGGDFDKLGRGHIWNGEIEPCIHQNHVFAVRPNKISSAWLNTITGSGYAQFYFMTRAKQSTNLASISSTNIMELPIVVPPDDEQRAILQFLHTETTKIDNLMAEQEKLIALLKEKRQAVIAHAVTKGLDPTVPMKDSGVEWLGEVPAHWRVIALKYLASMRSGGTPSKDNLDYWDGEIPWASAKDLKVDRLSDTGDHITQDAIDAGYALVPAGSVLVVVRGMILAKIFPVVQADVPMAINQDLKALVPLQGINNRFLCWLLRASEPESIRRTDEAGHGTKALRMDVWESMPLPAPNFEEQLAIAKFLDQEAEKHDELIAEAQKAIDLLKERRTALISAAVTGQIDVRGLVKDEQEQAA